MAKITISDVAAAAGVSTMTVSRVINGKREISSETRARVERAIERLGYRPNRIAQSLTTQRSNTIGLMLPDITNPFFPDIVRGAEDAAWQAGYTVLLGNTVEDPEREVATLELFEDNRVDGVVLCSTRLPDERLFPLVERHQAAVMVNRHAPDDLSGTVEVDDRYGTMRAVHHLLASDRQPIGLLAGPSHSFSGQRRLEGYRLALETVGLDVDDTLIRHGSPDEAGGLADADALLSEHPDVRSLICYNDLVAVGALQACAARGLSVPDDLAVIGCDDIRLAGLVTPALTTLSIDKYELGHAAVTMLLARMRGDSPPNLDLRPTLVVRQSAP